MYSFLSSKLGVTCKRFSVLHSFTDIVTITIVCHRDPQ